MLRASSESLATSRPRTESNLLSKRRMTVSQIDTAQAGKRCKTHPRAPTPFPRPDRDQALLFRVESDESGATSSASLEGQGVEIASATYDHLPTQLSRVVEAVRAVKENVAALYCRQESLSREEAAAVVIDPCEMILRNLLAASEMYSKSTKRTEEHTKAQLAAGIAAFLHSWE